ncbi:cytochrome c oxidase assembly protein COX16 homolog, mitochondrial-like [Babylonia areolata]|uniref:cytochrome c oxidase assembly protein COX16 homolog, mitochondrial-like n=1 Tax=Babylonia areolata TaxID=304850 RepID=UPI003FD6B0F4
MAAIVDWYRQVTRRRFIRFGIPFVVCIVGGSFALKQFASVRYDFRKGKMITNKEAEQYGVKLKTDGAKTIEDAYEELQEKDLDSWENIRGPRPWEDSKTVQDLQRNKI